FFAIGRAHLDAVNHAPTPHLLDALLFARKLVEAFLHHGALLQDPFKKRGLLKERKCLGSGKERKARSAKGASVLTGGPFVLLWLNETHSKWGAIPTDPLRQNDDI